MAVDRHGLRTTLIAERSGGIASFEGEAPTRGSGRGERQRKNERVAFRELREREHRAARCSICGQKDGSETPLLPIGGRWLCGADLTAGYDLVLTGQPLPEPPPLQEPMEPLHAGPVLTKRPRNGGRQNGS